MSLEWNVFLDDFNNNKIEVFNIFRHASFVEDCGKALLECGEDRAAFEERLRRELRYYFWSKCEYEIILSGWPPRERFKPSKVDVYDQVSLNWKIFTDYVWNNRAKLTPKKKGKRKPC